MNKSEEQQIREALAQIGKTAPSGHDLPTPPAQAFARLQARITAEEEARLVNRLKKRFILPHKQFRYAFTSILVILFLGIAFSFPAVRAAASEFLGLFRVQKFAAISVSPDQLAILERIAEEGLTPGEFEIAREPQMQPVDSLAEAQTITGLEPVRTLSSLGTPDEIYVTTGGNGSLTIDLAGARAIVEAAGGDPMLLPERLDGAQVHVAVFPGVEQRWGDISLVQTPSPLVEYPDGLDPVPLGKALLQVLGMNEAEAERLATEIDWTSTLLLPVPQNTVSFSEVMVNGYSGVALFAPEGAAIMWQDSGMVYLLGGAVELNELLDLAGSLE
ncbi:MAG: hypothetical protein D6706_00690 [Chloroflexi bacterium]|nr:MAG: hypothetical protein D6706_00690 [Chloroflexota bacterium]